MHQSTFSGVEPNFDCTMDDLDRLICNNDDFTDFVSAPSLPSVLTQPKALQGVIQERAVDFRHKPSPDAALQGRKQRALDKSREAQKRFRQRQKVCTVELRCFSAREAVRGVSLLAQARLDTIQSQLDETTKQLRDLRVQQQQLQTRNILLEKIAQLSKEQTNDDYLAWQVAMCALASKCHVNHCLTDAYTTQPFTALSFFA